MEDQTSRPYRPTNTRKWIQNRASIQHHIHVRIYPNDVHFDGGDRRSDVSRLARWITGKQIGLTLGGGGARGLAHLGVLKALDEAGIPVDVVGGTSQGAFCAAAAAMLHDPHDRVAGQHRLRLLTRFLAREMSSTWNKIKEITWPITSWFSGANFNQTMIDIFQGLRIEDLWLNFFCVSTDLTDSKEVVHRNGMLWRFVRASMTLSPYLPPICVSEGKAGDEDHVVHYLVDGGYVNIMPADVMRREQGPGSPLPSMSPRHRIPLQSMTMGTNSLGGGSFTGAGIHLQARHAFQISILSNPNSHM